MTGIKGNFLVTLFVVLILSDILDAQADETIDVICNVVGYIHGIGGPLFTIVIIGASLLAIFGRMPWPALFSLGMFIAVFFGASKIVTTITGKEACCLYEGQMMQNGKCVAAPGYEFVGQSGYEIPGGGVNCIPGLVFNNKKKCVKPSSPLWK